MWTKGALVIFLCLFVWIEDCWCNEDIIYEDFGHARHLKHVCGLHEEYHNCHEAPRHEITCDNLHKHQHHHHHHHRSRKHVFECNSGCFCKRGYVRDPITQKCMKIDWCHIVHIEKRCHDDNEMYLDCGPSSEKTCSNKKGHWSRKCKSGCFCRDGFVRSSEHHGTCIPEEYCPDQWCPKNEIWLPSHHAPKCEETCDYGCHHHYYNKLDFFFRSIKGFDKSGCYCRHGYVRESKNGKCIRKHHCREVCAPNEEYRYCGYECDESCHKDCHKHGRHHCDEGCFCREGYVRIHGKCVESYKCPKKCPYGEVWDCVDLCSEWCDDSKCVSPPYCIEKCTCSEGFKRGDHGHCIPKEKCEECPPGTEKRCIDPCEEYCDPNACITGVKSSKPSHPDHCKYICACPEGLKKLTNGTCVPICPEECKPNEELVCDYPCNNECDPNACDGVDLDLPCNYFCACQEGFKRDKNGDCVEKSTCPEECKPNENLICDYPCKNECDPNACDGVDLNLPCNYFCACEEGYKRDDNGDCVEEGACVMCPEFEVYNPNFGCEDSCSPSACIGTDVSGTPTKDCACEMGYKRDADGDCVLETQCFCGSNEVKGLIYDQCEISCDTNACDTVALPAEKTKQCICEEGYKKNLVTGLCVNEWEC